MAWWQDSQVEKVKIKNDEKRKKPRNYRVIRLGLLCALLALFIGGLLDWAFVFDSDASQNYLREHGIPTTATVLHTEETYDGCTCKHMVKYYFELPDGQDISGTAPIDAATYNVLKSGDSIDVLYAPDNPQNSALAAAIANRFHVGVRFPIFTVLLTASTLVLVWLFNRFYVMRWLVLGTITALVCAGGFKLSEDWLNSMVGLRQNGLSAGATITSLWKTGESGDSRNYHIQYEFDAPDANGRTTHYTFKQEISSSDYIMLAEGNTIPVRYYQDASVFALESDLKKLDDTLLKARAIYAGILATLVVMFVGGWIYDADTRERWRADRADV